MKLMLLLIALQGLDDAAAERLDARVHEVVAAVKPAFVFIQGGSGVLISPDGYMLTNHHVLADGAASTSKKATDVTLPGIKQFKADVIGKDPHGDIVLLKLRDAENLPHVAFGDADALAVGEYAIAVGDPFLQGRADFEPTVTVGVVSALHRYQNTYTDAIQTDASVNPGNSGGPLFNLRGELVGINGQIMARFGNRVNTGVGFAIPATQIQRFLPRFKVAKGGVVQHGKIDGLRLSNEWSDGQGGRVARVDSTAEKAGFKPDDWIVKVAGYPVHNSNRVLGVIGTFPAGEEIEIVVKRGDETHSLKVTLDPLQRDRPAGVDLGAQLGRAEGGGALVESVEEDGPAAASGLRVGDMIVAVDGQEVRSHLRVRRLLRGKEPGEKTTLTVRRGDEEIELTVEFPGG